MKNIEELLCTLIVISFGTGRGIKYPDTLDETKQQILDIFAEKDTTIDDLFSLACKYADEATKAESRVSELENELSTAVKYLKEGKKRFAPNTTNSHVDEFLKKYEKEKSHD